MSDPGNIGRPLIVIITVALISMTIISFLLVHTARQSTDSRIDLITRQSLRDDLVRDAKQMSGAVVMHLGNIEQTLSMSALVISNLDSTSEFAQERILMAQSRLAEYTDTLVWVSIDGRLAYATNDDFLTFIGSDLSKMSFYEMSFATNGPVITSPFASLDGSKRIAVAVPIPISTTDDTFNGSLAALIPFDNTASIFLEPYVLHGRSIMAITGNGTVLVHPVQSFVGKSIVGEQVALFASEETMEVAERNFERMLQGRSGVFEYGNLEGEEILMAYEPFMVNGLHVGTVAVFQQTSITREPFSQVFSEQQNFILLATILVGAISALFIIFILLINRRLSRMVSKQNKKIMDQLAELQIAYDRLKEQDTLKDEFINIAAHELRTPVLPIVLSAENLVDSLPDNEHVKIIMRNANRITKLTNDILDVSRIEGNTFKLQKQKTNLRKLVEDIIHDAQYRLISDQNVQIVLESSITPEQEELAVDQNRITQVLTNMLDNAINFTEKGEIRIKIEHDADNFVKISVIDQGNGIDPSIKDRLFGKFVSKSGKIVGTGLGLYLSKAIVVAHGGTIAGENNASGKGATFSFTLPVE